MIKKSDIVVVCGPTGIGKTSTAIGLSKALGGRIISADSMQIYRYMNIGTAKPTAEEQEQVPHDMVDIVDPDEPYDAARFSKQADIRIRSLWEQGLVPVVAGGTGLYIKALVSGLFRAHPADKAIIARLEKECFENGSPALHGQLAALDPHAAGRIHPNDAFRIIRALEIFETTGRPISECHEAHGFSDQPYRVLKLGLCMDRELLYERINMRVDLMLEQGLLVEVESLLERGYSPLLKSMGSLGYRHMIQYIQGHVTFEEAVRTLKRDSRRYAKRQMTWFRADSEIEWFEPQRLDAMVDRARIFLGKPSS
ncbi:MAG: tRNA (adenosine(37)-N6)-dimethylallyltransferase MiaA [Proteobacteria bacterium]|nr:tRNA (adenosine(37)-N6)-dimethylallyltransferase MiaA [Pseudomonadota bacterium]